MTFDLMPRLLLFRCSFCVATIRGWRLFLWKARRHRRLDKVHTSGTVTVARHCQSEYMQPFSPAVSRGKDSSNTISPSACIGPLSEIIRTRVRVLHLLASATIRGWRLQCILLRIVQLYYSRAATI